MAGAVVRTLRVFALELIGTAAWAVMNPQTLANYAPLIGVLGIVLLFIAWFWDRFDKLRVHSEELEAQLAALPKPAPPPAPVERQERRQAITPNTPATARPRPVPRHPPEPFDDTLGYPYPKAVLRASIDREKGTREKRSGDSEASKATWVMVIENSHGKALRDCSIALLGWSLDGAFEKVGEILRVGRDPTFVAFERQPTRFPILSRDISDSITPEPFVIKTQNRVIPLEENRQYVAELELRSRYRYPTRAYLQIDTGVGLDANIQIIEQKLLGAPAPEQQPATCDGALPEPPVDPARARFQAEEWQRMAERGRKGLDDLKARVARLEREPPFAHLGKETAKLGSMIYQLEIDLRHPPLDPPITDDIRENIPRPREDHEELRVMGSSRLFNPKVNGPYLSGIKAQIRQFEAALARVEKKAQAEAHWRQM